MTQESIHSTDPPPVPIILVHMFLKLDHPLSALGRAIAVSLTAFALRTHSYPAGETHPCKWSFAGRAKIAYQRLTLRAPREAKTRSLLAFALLGLLNVHLFDDRLKADDLRSSS
jgi:hypothetical protein